MAALVVQSRAGGSSQGLQKSAADALRQGLQMRSSETNNKVDTTRLQLYHDTSIPHEHTLCFLAAAVKEHLSQEVWSLGRTAARTSGTNPFGTLSIQPQPEAAGSQQLVGVRGAPFAVAGLCFWHGVFRHFSHLGRRKEEAHGDAWESPLYSFVCTTGRCMRPEQAGRQALRCALFCTNLCHRTQAAAAGGAFAHI